jgi:hypothetical protein
VGAWLNFGTSSFCKLLTLGRIANIGKGWNTFFIDVFIGDGIIAISAFLH